MPLQIDRFFQRGQDASLPAEGVENGQVARLINARVSNGSIKPAYRWVDVEIDVQSDQMQYAPLNPLEERGEAFHNFPVLGQYSWDELFECGKYQGGEFVENVYGRFIVMVVGGVVYQYDIDTCRMCPIFGPHPCLDPSCRRFCMERVGGWVVIGNWPNLPVLVGPGGGRFSNPNNNEVGPARIMRVAGNRMFAICGFNGLKLSDPFGGDSDFAPFTFEQQFQAGDFYDQIFTIGSSLDPDYIVGMCPIPIRDASTTEFSGNLMLISGTDRKYVLDTTVPRSAISDGSVQYIRNGPAGPPFAGCDSCTVSEYNAIYIANTGRIRSISTDQEVASGLVDNYIDDPLGRFDAEDKNWALDGTYENLEHDISPIETFRSRIYAGVSPICTSGCTYKGDVLADYVDQALAVGSVDSSTAYGERTPLSWEGFNTEVKPKDLIKVGEDELYCVSWEGGKNALKKLDSGDYCRKPVRVYTRSYFLSDEIRRLDPISVDLFFSELSRDLHVEVSYCVDDVWRLWGARVIEPDCCQKGTRPVRLGKPEDTCASSGDTLQLRITVKGGNFCLDKIRVDARIDNKDGTQSSGCCTDVEFHCKEDGEL